MKKQVNLNFHQTFKPEKQYISSILDVAGSVNELSVQEISAYTGIPSGASSGKVEPHILYANYMGLIDFEKKNGRYSILRTKLGELISFEDPGFQEVLTLLLCHAMMLRKEKGADMWSDIFLNIFPSYHNGIQRDILIKELSQIYNKKIQPRVVTPFWGSYDGIFSELNLLENTGDTVTLNKSLSYNSEFIYLYAYILFEFWDEMFGGDSEISEQQLNNMGFRNIFNWSIQEEYEVLEHMADYGIIRLNRQLVPYTIFREMKKDTVLENLYSQLF